MQNHLIVQVCLFMFVATAYKAVLAQSFEGITPIKSTCKDVERIMGGSYCGKPDETIKRENERIRFAFSTRPCENFYGQRWQIPIGTVVIVERRFRYPPELVSLGIKVDESQYVKTYTDVIGQAIYEKKTGEIAYSTIDGRVVEIVYYPSNADRSRYACDPIKKRASSFGWIRQGSTSRRRTFAVAARCRVWLMQKRYSY